MKIDIERWPPPRHELGKVLQLTGPKTVLDSGVDAAEPPRGEPDQHGRVAAQHGEAGPG